MINVDDTSDHKPSPGRSFQAIALPALRRPPMPKLPENPDGVGEECSTSFLEFVPQTGQPKRDAKVKKLVRKHARNYVSRSKGIHKREPLLQFQLSVPEEFGSGDGLTEVVNLQANRGQDEFTSSDFLLGVEALNRGFSLEPLDDRTISDISDEASGWILGDRTMSPPILEKKAGPTPKVRREKARKPKAKSGCNGCK